MDASKKFLADRLLVEVQPVTYRTLSRALDVHVNTAKRMLYDFHQCQNSLRADSIHATYLLFGIKPLKLQHEDGCDKTDSSAPQPRSEVMPAKTITLVGEEKLEDVLREYREITSIHIYSLAPREQKDVALLADIAISISEASRKDESFLASSKYGAIPNPLVRRRDTRGRPAIPAGGTSKPIQQERSQAERGQTIKTEQGAETPPKDPKPPTSSGKVAAPAVKRSGSGGIMQSFARAASKPPHKAKQMPKEEDTDAMALSDDGEADDSDIPPSKKTISADQGIGMKSRKEREEELKRMMDEDDAEPDIEDNEPDDEMEEDPEPDPEPEIEPEVEPEEIKDTAAEDITSSGNGRRRGKRRVMKKKRILDEQGYMVTIQEPGWESFSEDETPQPPTKKTTPSSTPSSSGAKGKKSGSKAGHGNIMSFFSKK